MTARHGDAGQEKAPPSAEQVAAPDETQAESLYMRPRSSRSALNEAARLSTSTCTPERTATARTAFATISGTPPVAQNSESWPSRPAKRSRRPGTRKRYVGDDSSRKRMWRHASLIELSFDSQIRG